MPEIVAIAAAPSRRASRDAYLRKTMQPLMDDGKVRTEGERRGRRYFVVA